MAKVNISVDTDNKSVVVTIDGNTIENVTDVSMYVDSAGKPMVRISTSEKTDGGVEKYTTYYAQASEEGKQLLSSQAAVYNKNIPGFIGVEKTVEQISMFIGKKLRHG